MQIKPLITGILIYLAGWLLIAVLSLLPLGLAAGVGALSGENSDVMTLVGILTMAATFLLMMCLPAAWFFGGSVLAGWLGGDARTGALAGGGGFGCLSGLGWVFLLLSSLATTQEFLAEAPQDAWAAAVFWLILAVAWLVSLAVAAGLGALGGWLRQR